MEKTEETVRIWRCTKCNETQFRSGEGPHFCTKKREYRDLFGKGTHTETCNGRMIEEWRRTDTDAQNAETK